MFDNDLLSPLRGEDLGGGLALGMPTFDEFNFPISISSFEVHAALLDLGWDVMLYRSLVPLIGGVGNAAAELEETWVFLHDIWLFELLGS